MEKHFEFGTTSPMRPKVAYLGNSTGFQIITQDAPPVDWTAANTRIPVAINSKAMDDADELVIANNNISLPAGQFEIEMNPVFVSSGAVGTMSLAITNDDGSVIYRESDPVTLPAGFSRNIRLVAYVHLTAPAEVALRAAGTIASTMKLDAGNSHVAIVRKIGNVNEA